MKKPRPWPPVVEKCGKCGLGKGEVDYRARGLCNVCYHREQRAGRLHQWICLQATYKGQGNLALRACMTVGKTQVSSDLGISVDVLEKWISKGVPVNSREKLHDYVANLQYLAEAGAGSKAREALFPEKGETQSALRIIFSAPNPDWL